jgi:hypothetical protein
MKHCNPPGRQQPVQLAGPQESAVAVTQPPSVQVEVPWQVTQASPFVPQGTFVVAGGATMHWPPWQHPAAQLRAVQAPASTASSPVSSPAPELPAPELPKPELPPPAMPELEVPPGPELDEPPIPDEELDE